MVFVFPIWAAIHGYRKGYKNLAIVTGILTIVPFFGAICGLILFFSAKLYRPNYNYAPSPYAMIGFGTKFYGASEKATDGSFITTLWFIALYIPIFPIQSYRISRSDEFHKFQGAISSSGFNFSINEYLKLYWAQILRTYGLLFSFVLIVSFLGWITQGSKLLAPLITGLLVAYIVAGYYLLRAK